MPWAEQVGHSEGLQRCKLQQGSDPGLDLSISWAPEIPDTLWPWLVSAQSTDRLDGMLLAERVPGHSWGWVRPRTCTGRGSGSMDGMAEMPLAVRCGLSSFRKHILLDVCWEVSYLSLILHSLSKVLTLKWDRDSFSLKKCYCSW